MVISGVVNIVRSELLDDTHTDFVTLDGLSSANPSMRGLRSNSNGTVSEPDTSVSKRPEFGDKREDQRCHCWNQMGDYRRRSLLLRNGLESRSASRAGSCSMFFCLGSRHSKSACFFKAAK